MIRPITQFDVESVQRLASDPAIAATANLPLPYPQNGAAQWFDRISKGIAENRQVVFAVTQEGVFIGVMSLNAIDLNESQCALDYWIGKPHWGHGYASRAAALALAYAKHVLGLSRVTSGCLKENPGSKRVLEKSGFTFTSESEYKGPFMDRFGSKPMLHCTLEFKTSSAEIG
jgi:RimJ/RimL family protein N-acetyltransferase